MPDLPPQPARPTPGVFCTGCRMPRRHPLLCRGGLDQAVSLAIWVCPMCDLIWQQLANWERQEPLS